MIPYKPSVWDAFNILQGIKGTKKDDISSRICEAQEIVAGAYGLTILPAMKWSVEERFDNFNFIPLFIGSVASDIRSYENERECESWLKNVGQEKFASKRVGQLLVAFDDAYKKWRNLVA
jgi:hypothetical protein